MKWREAVTVSTCLSGALMVLFSPHRSRDHRAKTPPTTMSSEICHFPEIAAQRVLNATKANPGPTFNRRVLSAYERLPLRFEANVGQSDAQVKYLAHGSSYSLFVLQGEALLSLRGPEPFRRWSPGERSFVGITHVDRSVLRIQPIGASPSTMIEGVSVLPGKSNYFIGNDPKAWHGGVPAYAEVVYRNLYSGIDMVYRGNQGHVEHDFIVRRGSNPSVIRYVLRGAEETHLDPHGNLVFRVGGLPIRLDRPLAFQEVKGSRKKVAVAYKLSGRELSFQVGVYDRSKTLIIDPTLSYSTYLGGTGDDLAFAIAVDQNGNTFVTGRTTSADFPQSQPGARGAIHDGSFDVFVAELNPSGSAVVYSTFIGGAGDDEGFGIAVDQNGHAYATGFTSSNDFPNQPGILQAAYGGGLFDAFVLELDADGDRLVYSTFLGGNDDDEAYGIALDTCGDAFVTGLTASADFPNHPAKIQAAYGGGIHDAFVAEIGAGGKSLVYSTYLGGGGDDQGYGIDVSVDGNAFITGVTSSTDFPNQPGTIQPAYGGGKWDSFVAEMDPGATRLVYSTFLGGSNLDAGEAIRADANENAYVAGVTLSINFPVTDGAAQISLAGRVDAFVAKVRSGGGALDYSTYYGGTGGEEAFAISIDGTGNAYAVGVTDSTDLPTTSASFQSKYGGGPFDAFLLQLNPAGTKFTYSTYLGGIDDDQAFGMALDSQGNAYIAGMTASVNFPTTQGTFQLKFSGGPHDAFISKFAFNSGPQIAMATSPAPSDEGRHHEGEGGCRTGEHKRSEYDDEDENKRKEKDDDHKK